MQLNKNILVLITTSKLLLDHVEKIAAVSGFSLQTFENFSFENIFLEQAKAVLVGAEIEVKFLQRRENVFLVTMATELVFKELLLYQKAMQIGASDILVFPNSDEWLTEHLSKTPSNIFAAKMLGITNACGGAGASTLAMAVAFESVKQGYKTLLLDADICGGGLDFALGIESFGGNRWADLLLTRGYVTDTSLQEALPQSQGFSVLSWDRRACTIDAQMQEKIFTTIKVMCKVFEIIVSDIATDLVLGEIFRKKCNSLFMVTPARLRAVAAVNQKILQYQHKNLHLIVGGALTNEITTNEIIKYVDLPILGNYKYQKILKTDLSEGNLNLALKRKNLSNIAKLILSKAEQT